jgi:hypothetical protein
MVKLTQILIALFLFALASIVRADDNCERDRKARVALALTAAKPSPSPKGQCACGDACNCVAGKCPACPAASATATKPAAPPLVTYREVWYSDGRRVWKQLEPMTAGEACPNGRCSLSR